MTYSSKKKFINNLIDGGLTSRHNTVDAAMENDDSVNLYVNSPQNRPTDDADLDLYADLGYEHDGSDAEDVAADDLHDEMIDTFHGNMPSIPTQTLATDISKAKPSSQLNRPQQLTAHMYPIPQELISPELADPLYLDPLSADRKTPLTQAAIFLGNFSYWTTDQKLWDIIASIGITDVTRVNIHMDKKTGKSKGYGIIEFGSEISANKCINELPKLTADDTTTPPLKFATALQQSMKMEAFAKQIGKEPPEMSFQQHQHQQQQQQHKKMEAPIVNRSRGGRGGGGHRGGFEPLPSGRGGPGYSDYPRQPAHYNRQLPPPHYFPLPNRWEGDNIGSLAYSALPQGGYPPSNWPMYQPMSMAAGFDQSYDPPFDYPPGPSFDGPRHSASAYSHGDFPPRDRNDTDKRRERRDRERRDSSRDRTDHHRDDGHRDRDDKRHRSETTSSSSRSRRHD